MNPEAAFSRQFLILADESADWRVAGLRQLERLVYATNEWLESLATEEKTELVILWHPDIPLAQRRLPQCRQVPRVQWTESLNALREGAQVFSTRLFVERNGFGSFVDTVKAVRVAEQDLSFSHLAQEFEQSCLASPGGSRQGGWRFLAQPSDIVPAESSFLRNLGKSQDGFISRVLNRPLSRAASAQLLKYPISPATFTFSLLLLPILAFFFVAHGSYASIVIGAILFQLFSMLDGCDGEMARATYSESAKGARLDYLCDMAGNLLFVVGLGLGLWRYHSIYLLEGMLCALAITANEFSLRGPTETSTVVSDELTRTLYPRHRAMLQNSGVAVLGEGTVSWMMQLTKRDVSVVFFLLLALANLPEWILHFWLAVALGSFVLARRAVRARA